MHGGHDTIMHARRPCANLPPAELGLEALDLGLERLRAALRVDVDDGAVADALRAVREQQRGQRLVRARLARGHVGDEDGLRVAADGVTQQEGELAVAEGDVAPR